MDKLFLYAVRDSTTYREVEIHLRAILSKNKLIILPTGLGFFSSQSLLLRANDTIILYSENINDLNQLITMSGDFQFYRILLLVNEESQLKDNNYLSLYPRYTLSIETGMNSIINYLNYYFQ